MKKNVLSSLALLGVVWGMCAALASAAVPETLSLADLANRPDRWPATVTLQRDLRFTAGLVIHQGEQLQLVRFDGSGALVADAGHHLFKLTPEDCGLLDAANQAWAALTPAQRAVAPETLAGDLSLWPARVAATTQISCTFGKLPAGTELTLLTVSHQGLDVAWPNSANRLSIDFGSTDAIARARKLVLLAPDQRPSRIAAALQGILVDSDGKPYHDEHLNDKKFFALYFGAGWCPPCQAFSPDFVKFLNDAMPRHPELAVVFLSDDKQLADMLAYMKKEQMPFPAVPPNVVTHSSPLSNYEVQLIPHLVIVDRFGKALADNDDGRGNRIDPMDTVAALGKLLAAAPAPQ
jgi:thiol-disulfide isomerase/thioredoxin